MNSISNNNFENKYFPENLKTPFAFVSKKLHEIASKVIQFIKENKEILLLTVVGMYTGAGIGFKIGSVPGAVVGSVIGGTASYLIFKKLFGGIQKTFCPNYCHKVGKAWEVHEIVSIEKIDNQLKEILRLLKNTSLNPEGHPPCTLWDIYQELSQDDKIFNEKDRKSFCLDLNTQAVLNNLKQGLCYGQSRVQVEHAHTQHDSTANMVHQIPKDHANQVIYYQILRNIQSVFQAFLGSKRTVLASAMSHSSDAAFANYPRLIAQASEAFMKIAILLVQAAEAKHLKISQPFNCQASVKEYEKILDEQTKGFSSDLIVSGMLVLKGPPDQPSHAVWFQYSDNNKYRMQDTINSDQGLFEFSNKTEFLTALSKQMGVGSIYQNGQATFEIWGISKKTA